MFHFYLDNLGFCYILSAVYIDESYPTIILSFAFIYKFMFSHLIARHYLRPPIYRLVNIFNVF